MLEYAKEEKTMKHELIFEDALADDEIYQDQRIVAFTRTNQKSSKRIFNEYGSYEEILNDELMERERRRRFKAQLKIDGKRKL